MLLKEGQSLVLRFAGIEGLEPELDLVKEIYAAEQQFFRQMIGRITTELREDPRRAQWLRGVARLDSRRIEQFRQAVFAEHSADVTAAQRYVRTLPQSRGIRIPCRLACRQLIAAASGMNVFD